MCSVIACTVRHGQIISYWYCSLLISCMALGHDLQGKAWPDWVEHLVVKHDFAMFYRGPLLQVLFARWGMARFSCMSCGRTRFCHIPSIIQFYRRPCFTFPGFLEYVHSIVWHTQWYILTCWYGGIVWHPLVSYNPIDPLIYSFIHSSLPWQPFEQKCIFSVPNLHREN